MLQIDRAWLLDVLRSMIDSVLRCAEVLAAVIVEFCGVA